MYWDDCAGPTLDCVFFENKYIAIRFKVKRAHHKTVSVAHLLRLQETLNEILGPAEAPEKPLTEFQRLKQEYQASLTEAKKSAILEDENSGKE